VSRNHPGAIAGTHGHNSLGGIDKLVAIMKMQRDHVSRGIVVREGGNLGVTVGQRFENCTLALLRHSLSQYRKYELPAIVKLGLSKVSCGERVNLLHHWLCRSARWRKTVQQRVPWVISQADLGQNVLELGPGPGLTTGLLRLGVQRLTALEIDAKAAESLGSRLRGSNVEVVGGDATAMPFGDARFSGGASFTMLHHVPTADLQDKLLREVWRVLKPGGVFVGSDSLQGWLRRLIHIGDTLVPVDPDAIGRRLETAGFEVLEVERNADAFRFHARRPPLRG
jgi:SAM-dependent methyltransferase